MSGPSLELINKELANRSLYEFVKQAWHVVEPGRDFVDGRHIQVICQHLEQLDPDSLEGPKEEIINIPPRHMKSLLICVFWPAWVWGPQNKPHTQFLFSSYSLKLARRDNLKRRRLIQSSWYQSSWGNRFSLAGDQNQKDRFENDHNGHCLIASPDSSTTGEGGDVVVVDDPHNVCDAYSETERENTITWWDEAMSTRLNDPKRGVKLIIGQRVHESDLCGHALAYGTYRHLCLPAEYEHKHPYQCADDWRTAEGELLWPERIDEKVIAGLKKALRQSAAGQLQQRPAPAEGNIFKRAWMRFYDRTPERFDVVIQSWDMAFKANSDSSYVVGQLWGRVGADCYLLDQIREHLDFPSTLSAVKRFTELHPRSTVKLIEDKANGPAVLAMLSNQIPGMIAVKADVSKEARANAITWLFESGNVYIPRSVAWIEDYIQELCDFPNGSNDDQVDATSQALARLIVKTTPFVGFSDTAERSR